MLFHPLVSHWRLSGQGNHHSHREILYLLMCFFDCIHFVLFNSNWERGMDTLAHAICCVWCDIDTVTVIKNSEQLTEQVDAMFPWKTKSKDPLDDSFLILSDSLPFQKYLYLQLWHFVWMIVLYRKYFGTSSRHHAWSQYYYYYYYFVLRC